jgi:hypothetical protein
MTLVGLSGKYEIKRYLSKKNEAYVTLLVRPIAAHLFSFNSLLSSEQYFVEATHPICIWKVPTLNRLRLAAKLSDIPACYLSLTKY